jgi:hypothetical protein
MGATSLLSYLYPRMIAIHDLDEHVGIPDLNSSWIPLPTPMRPSYLYMEAHGAYLIGGIHWTDTLHYLVVDLTVIRQWRAHCYLDRGRYVPPDTT